jgi:hypothetical protein
VLFVRSKSDELLLNCILDQVTAVMQVQLLHQAGAVSLDGLDGKVPNFSDLTAGLAFCDQL